MRPDLIELGAFIRSRRELLTPERAGLPGTRRRRTPGLRREEVSDLAGISPHWYTRIESGTGAVPSVATLHAIARALRLSAVETDYIFELSGLATPKSACLAPKSGTIAIENLVMALDVNEVAAFVADAFASPRCWNDTADAIFRWSTCRDSFERNCIVGCLTDPYYRECFGDDFEDAARALVGGFRRAYTTSEPTSLARRVYDFACTLPLFQAIWNEHTVSEHYAPPGTIRRYVPEVGPLELDFVDFQPVPHQGLFLRVLTPHDHTTRHRFLALATRGVASRFLEDED
jgi:transcriptional regulator with XRE-family HTH domain